MVIKRKSLLEGTAQADGIAVIIDVFRAFTCLPLLFYKGASKVILERDVHKARALKSELEDAILVGEDKEVPIEGSDIGNSPHQILCMPHIFKDRTVIHRTTAGIVGVFEALKKAKRVFMAGFINAKATAETLKSLDPDLVTLVPMGERGLTPSPEDEACADYLYSLLKGDNLYDHLYHLKEILNSPSFKKFLDHQRPYLYPEDPIICLQRDLIPVSLEAVSDGDLVIARPLWQSPTLPC